MTAAIAAGLLAGWAIALPVGAIGAYLVGLTAQTSLRVGAAAALGVATADGVYALVAVAGGGSLRHTAASVAGPMRLVAAVALAGIGIRGVVQAARTYRSGPVAEMRATARPATSYLRLTGLTLVNPATVVYFAALVVGNRDVSTLSLQHGVVFAAAAFCASASWQLTLAATGAAVGRVLTGPRGRVATALVSGCVILALAVDVAVRGR